MINNGIVANYEITTNRRFSFGNGFSHKIEEDVLVEITPLTVDLSPHYTNLAGWLLDLSTFTV